MVDTSALLAVLFHEEDYIPYALAYSLSEPLLYKGNDFSRTDIEPVGFI